MFYMFLTCMSIFMPIWGVINHFIFKWDGEKNKGKFWDWEI